MPHVSQRPAHRLGGKELAPYRALMFKKVLLRSIPALSGELSGELQPPCLVGSKSPRRRWAPSPAQPKVLLCPPRRRCPWL